MTRILALGSWLPEDRLLHGDAFFEPVIVSEAMAEFSPGSAWLLVADTSGGSGCVRGGAGWVTCIGHAGVDSPPSRHRSTLDPVLWGHTMGLEAQWLHHNLHSHLEPMFTPGVVATAASQVLSPSGSKLQVAAFATPERHGLNPT